MGHLILVINPGSTSTKLSLFEDDEELHSKVINIKNEELAKFTSVISQADYRMKGIEAFMEDCECLFGELAAVVGRGGIVRPIKGGVYAVDEQLLRDLSRGKPWEHAANLGGILAQKIAATAGIPAFIADPVSVDELLPIARISGAPELPYNALQHTLNIKASVRKAAADMGKKFDEISAVVAHMGGGISICAHCKGAIVDANNANERGPFSPERAGSLPALALVRMAFSGDWNKQNLRKEIAGRGGMVNYLGTSDLREVRKRIDAGDEHAKLVFDAMALQISQYIGAYSAILKGEADAVILTGGAAHDSKLVDYITRRVKFIAPVMVYAGENEMIALCEAALRVLRGIEPAGDYAKASAAREGEIRGQGLEKI